VQFTLQYFVVTYVVLLKVHQKISQISTKIFQFLLRAHVIWNVLLLLLTLWRLTTPIVVVPHR